jgi:hypothetical protein
VHSLLARSPVELTAIFYSHLRFPQPGGSAPRIYIPQEHGGPRALGSLFVASYESQGYGGGIITRLHKSQIFNVELEVEGTLRPTVSRRVRLGALPFWGK